MNSSLTSAHVKTRAAAFILHSKLPNLLILYIFIGIILFQNQLYRVVMRHESLFLGDPLAPCGLFG